MKNFNIEDARETKGSNDMSFSKKAKDTISGTFSTTLCGISTVLIVVGMCACLLLASVQTQSKTHTNLTGRNLLSIEGNETLAPAWQDSSITPLEERYSIVHGCVDKSENCRYDDRRGLFSVIMLSILISGCLGVDRCYMGFVCCGFCKAITLGGFFIWWMIDSFSLMTGNWMYDEDGCCPVLGFKPLN